MTLLEKFPVRLCQMLVRPGDIARNTESILRMMARARADGIRLVVFPELAVSGILMEPDWPAPPLLRDCEAAVGRIIAESRGIAVIFGAPMRVPGGLIANAVVAAEDGAPLGHRLKRLSRENRFDRATGLACVSEVADPPPGGPFALSGLTVQMADEPYPPPEFSISPPGLLLSVTSPPYVRHRSGGGGVYSDTLPTGPPPFARCSAVGVVDAGKAVFLLEGASRCVMPGGGPALTAPRFTEAALAPPPPPPNS